MHFPGISWWPTAPRSGRRCRTGADTPLLKHMALRKSHTVRCKGAIQTWTWERNCTLSHFVMQFRVRPSGRSPGPCSEWFDRLEIHLRRPGVLLGAQGCSDLLDLRGESVISGVHPRVGLSRSGRVFSPTSCQSFLLLLVVRCALFCYRCHGNLGRETLAGSLIRAHVSLSAFHIMLATIAFVWKTLETSAGDSC